MNARDEREKPDWTSKMRETIDEIPAAAIERMAFGCEGVPWLAACLD